MTDLPSLTHTILSKQTIDELYTISTHRAIINVEKEIKRRLISCDPELSIPVIDFLYKFYHDKIVKDQWFKSVYVREGLREAIECIPWKIGVIYNYTDQSYRINRVAIMVGKSTKFRTKQGKYYQPDWLNAEETKLMLREVISQYNHPINNVMSIITHDTNLDNSIRHALLDNDVVTITVCLFLPPQGSVFHSFPEEPPLPDSERKQMYPCHITAGNFSHKLIDYPGNILAYLPRNYDISIEKSDDLEKLFQLNSLVGNITK